MKRPDPNCVCGNGVIHSMATEDIKAGQSVMTVTEGTGRSRRWITVPAPFQIHEEVKKQYEEAVELDRATTEQQNVRNKRSQI